MEGEVREGRRIISFLVGRIAVGDTVAFATA
jgi:hypothetical protein